VEIINGATWKNESGEKNEKKDVHGEIKSGRRLKDGFHRPQTVIRNGIVC
jgi:hypothetical protein